MMTYRFLIINLTIFRIVIQNESSGQKLLTTEPYSKTEIRLK